MTPSELFDRIGSWGDRPALFGEGWCASYNELLAESGRWAAVLDAAGIGSGRVVAFDGDCRDRTAALMLTLFLRGCIAVPLTSATASQRDEFLRTAQAEFVIDGRRLDEEAIAPLPGERAGHPLLADLTDRGSPGLILFSSGSTGVAKAIVHDVDRLLRKFGNPRTSLRMIAFLLLDHIGGINTLLHGLAHGGAVVCVEDRHPSTICRAIARHQVEVLPTSPTFLNLLLISGEHRCHDLSSLKLVTYGTEPMPASTLARLRQELPGVTLQQTYGLSELGILRSQSRNDGSLWVRVGGEGYETRVVDGVLWIRAESAMLGYLNASSPFDDEGWFNTQDVVEQDGEWLRFLGRTGEIINVGGQKVYPAEVESVLLEMQGVGDVTVRGEPNPLVGQCVAARVNLTTSETLAEFKSRMRHHCRERLAPYMVPVKVEFTDDPQFSSRVKRVRQA